MKGRGGTPPASLPEEGPTAVLGAGSWGTALALHLSRSGLPVTLWARSRETAEVLRSSGANTSYLPGESFPANLRVTHHLEDALRRARRVLFVVPAQFCRPVFRSAGEHLSAGTDLVIASKGIEEKTLLRMSEVLAEEMGEAAGRGAAVLSGPSFAAEVARGDPTAVVVAGEDAGAAARVQQILSRGSLRAYTSRDRAGVELAGAMKNVVAIATGISEGLGFGHNTRAALITRGMAEITRLGTRLGGRPGTFAGLAGTGDLVLTCTGTLSRNRAVGVEIGKGGRLDRVIASMRMVAEGVATTGAVVLLARRHSVEMPIAESVHAVLFEGRSPRDAVTALLARPLKEEA